MNEKIDVTSAKRFLGLGIVEIKKLFLEAFDYCINDVEEKAYANATETGISRTISALYEADVEDAKIIDLLNKYWEITQTEAEERLCFEKDAAPQRAVEHFLKMEGKTKQEIRSFCQKVDIHNKLKENPELRALRKTPAALIERLQDLS